MNPTYLESFFSYERFFFDGAMKDLLSSATFRSLFDTRKPILLRSLLGTFRTKLVEMHRPSAIRVPVIEQYGYDIKSASHALRLAHLFFSITNDPYGDPFKVYENGLRLSGKAKDVILGVKLGQFKENDILPWLERAESFLSSQVDLFAKEKVTYSGLSEKLKKVALEMIGNDFRIRLRRNSNE